MKEIIFYSHNLHKIHEVKDILKNNKIKLLTLESYPKIVEPVESGSTFSENAEIKSTYGFKKFCLPCFADDSGICISALNNQPGVNSKRFQLENGGFKNTFKLIVEKTKKERNFNAYFQTTIALTIEKNKTFFFEGVVKGKISAKPIGSQGFHYDPIFIPNNSKKTYAQMTSNEKNHVSHRYKALKKLKFFLDTSFY